MGRRTVTEPDQVHTVYVLKLRPLPGTDPIRSLRWVLKRLLRQHGFRCLSLSQESIRAGGPEPN